ncbi:MAG: GNAT family N-acetyltransferase [Alphaproteobacteria bacterium]|nr:GNAT family N-acetyltransferase [Alphaproteobacteria bacterium]
MLNDLIQLFYQSEDFFYRAISRECLDFEDKASFYITGLHSEYSNPFTLRKNIPTFKKILTECTNFAQNQNINWIVTISQYVMDKNLESTLNQMSFKLDSKTTPMFIVLNHDDDICQNNHLIINMNDNLNDWITPLSEAFESNFEQTGLYKQVRYKALNNKNNFYHFTLYDNSSPIASLTLSINNNIARIDNVGTLPEYQSQGYARSIISFTLDEAKRLGATHCFLDALPEGIPLYQQIGFNPLFQNYIFKINI